MAAINYERTVSQANQIGDLARELNQEIMKLESLMTQTKNGWCGPASDAFRVQLQRLISDLRITQSNLAGVSAAVKDAANQIMNP